MEISYLESRNIEIHFNVQVKYLIEIRKKTTSNVFVKLLKSNFSKFPGFSVKMVHFKDVPGANIDSILHSFLGYC